jgi:hypothetical protein
MCTQRVFEGWESKYIKLPTRRVTPQPIQKALSADVGCFHQALQCRVCREEWPGVFWLQPRARLASLPRATVPLVLVSLLARAGELWVNPVRLRPQKTCINVQVKLYNLIALSQVIFLRATGLKKLMCSSIYLREFGHIASKWG